MTNIVFTNSNNRHFGLTILSLLLVSIFLFSSCTEKNKVAQHDLKKYYFPYKNLDQPKMYAFHATVDNSEAPEYWIFKSFIHNNDTLIEKKIFDHNLNLIQKEIEKVISDGIVLQSSTIYELDSTKMITSSLSIQSDDVFPFAVEDEKDLWISNTHWDNPIEENSSFTFIKNKHFKGYEDFEVIGNKHRAINIESKNLIENINDGSLEILYNAEEIYVENIGLAYFRKEFAENSVREYKLAKIYNKEEFQKWFP